MASRSREHWTPGDHVLVRDVWQGVVLTAIPHTVVRDSEDLVALYRAPGTEWAAHVFDERMEGYERAAEGEVYTAQDRRVWHTNHALVLMRPGDAYAPQAFRREEDGEFVGWYVNLQAPFRRSRFGFDTMDSILDLIVAPDLSSWQWKDEQELDRVVELGLVSKRLADGIRAAGEEVIAVIERGEAWWTEWADWSPDPAWPIPTLPDGWERV